MCTRASFVRSSIVAVTLGVSLGGEAVAQFQTIVHPPVSATVEGGTRRAMFTQSAERVRYQEIVGFSSNPFVGVVQKVAYRRDNDTFVSSGDYATFSADFTMTLSTSPRTPVTISPVFAANVGSDATLVHSGTVNWPAQLKLSPGPAPFAYAVFLSWFFTYDASAGDMCVEIVTQPIVNPNVSFLLDAHQVALGTQRSVLGSPCGLGSTNGSTVYDNWAPGSWARALQFGGPASTPSVALFGTPAATIGGIPLPLDLVILGAPGCLLQHDLGLGQIVGGTDSTGRWDLHLAIPDIAYLGGKTLRLQFVNLLDAGAGNPAQLSLTAGHRITLASPVPGAVPQSEALAGFLPPASVPATAQLVQLGYSLIIELTYL